MTPRDFCYWLQGRFEVGGCDGPAPVSAAQVAIIKKHLELTKMAKFDPARIPDAAVGAGFCQWLDGLFAGNDCASGMSDDVARKMQAKLNDIFLHVIDPTFANQAELSRAHSGDQGPVLGGRREGGLGRDAGGVVAMC